MANHYLQTVFTVPVTPAEAAMLEECFAVSAEISGDLAELPAEEMNVLKERYPGRMDFAKACGMVKGLLQ